MMKERHGKESAVPQPTFCTLRLFPGLPVIVLRSVFII
jgi:hypothetical protein